MKTGAANPPAPPFDGAEFRTVLGHFPTGVTIVTSLSDGEPVGMTIGAFTSVSLDPPLVAFLPDKSSSTFPHIREAGSFCVNFLAAAQHDVCRTFSSRSEDKFFGIGWKPAPDSSAPRLQDAVGWLDCTIETVHEAGDHYIVIGRVTALGHTSDSLPLLFFQGGFGKFSSLTLSAFSEPDLLKEMYYADLARSEMEQLANATGSECLLLARQKNETLVLGCAHGDGATSAPLRVGQRYPLVPPMGSLFVAWDERETAAWVERANPNLVDSTTLQALITNTRTRGWSLGLSGPSHERFAEALRQLSVEDPTPAQERKVAKAAHDLEVDLLEIEDALGSHRVLNVRSINAPIFGASGRVELVLSLIGYSQLTTDRVDHALKQLLESAENITSKIGGRRPV